MLSTRIFVFSVALLGMTNVALSAPINETTGDLKFFEGGTNSEGLANFDASFDISGNYTRTLSGLPSNITGDANVTLTAAGDFFAGFENVSLSIDGIALGRFLDSVPGNDEFDNSSFGDEGYGSAQSGTRSATAQGIDLSGALSDSMLDLTYNFGTNVDDLSGTDFLRTDISYETGSTTSVPVPPTFTFLGIGLLGVSLFGRWRRRF